MKAKIKSEAVNLRKKGYSFREISEKLKISKSTASLWLRDVELLEKAKERIARLEVAGRRNARKSIKNRIARENELIMKRVKNSITQCNLLKDDLKIICALLYWCEGGKTEKSQLTFINSDPKLIKYFISILRTAFEIDENRFRVLVHVHGYHDIDRQIEYWSKLTRIPKKQFIKPYIKQNSGKRIKDNYQGCVSIRYHGKKLRQEIMFLINEISK